MRIFETVRSLGYRTDLQILAALGGEIVTAGDGVLVACFPDNPGFYWGNFLLFPVAPGPGDVDRWRARFEAELGRRGGVEHVALGWDDPAGAPGHSADFVAAGYTYDEGVVMYATAAARPERSHPELVVRPLVTDRDWLVATEIQIASRGEAHEPEAYRLFKQTQMATYRRLCERGALVWYGGFEGDAQIANLGLSQMGCEWRFQAVATHPDHERKGACGRLVYEASRRAFEAGARGLVMVADEHEGARRVYARAGFEVRERQVGLWRPGWARA